MHIARPVTVVRDDAELLAVWLAPGTECVKPVLADGTPVHLEPLVTRYTKPRTVQRDQWFGTGVLKLARPGEPWSVWLFWDPGWRFKNWYVNLEEPLARWEGGVDSEDHFLDISVHPDRSWYWRDEDEFAQAQRDRLMDAALAERVRRAGRSAVADIRAWGSPTRTAGSTGDPIRPGRYRRSPGTGTAHRRMCPHETLDAPPGKKRRIVLRNQQGGNRRGVHRA